MGQVFGVAAYLSPLLMKYSKLMTLILLALFMGCADTKETSPMDLVERLIIRNEGFKRAPYLDAEGNTIIGAGHNLRMSLADAQKRYPQPLTSSEVKALLSEDLKKVETQARGVFGKSWVSLNTARQAVVIDMLFNLGIVGFSEFHDFIDAVKKRRWGPASKAILDSLAARENPMRYQRNANVIEKGDSLYFQLR